jgi:hypothetical protein
MGLRAKDITFAPRKKPTMDIQSILRTLNIQDHNHGVMIGTESFGSGPTIDSISPVDGKKIASLSSATADEYERAMKWESPCKKGWVKCRR